MQNRRADDARLVVLETKFGVLSSDVTELKADVKKIVKAIDMTEGGWKALVKICGVLLVLAGGVAWLIDHLGVFKKLFGG